MVRDAYTFLLPLAILGLTGLVLTPFWPWLLVPGALCILLASFVAFFFRDPERDVPMEPGVIVSPADGRVVLIGSVPDGNQVENGTLVSIFLSVLDVHVNRAPLAGKITGIEYRRGSFLVAMNHRASVENEQNVVTIDDGVVRVVFKQIAGLIARRIVFSKELGTDVARGERVGLIKFGSRVDVLLPSSIEVAVKRGDRVKGGVTVLGRVKS